MNFPHFCDELCMCIDRPSWAFWQLLLHVYSFVLSKGFSTEFGNQRMGSDVMADIWGILFEYGAGDVEKAMKERYPLFFALICYRAGEAGLVLENQVGKCELGSCLRWDLGRGGLVEREGIHDVMICW